MIKRLPQVEAPEKYLEFALSRAMKKISQYNPKGQGVEKAQKKEMERLLSIRDSLFKYLNKIHDGWPSIDELSEFYIMLIEHTVSVDKLKHALGSIGYAKNTIQTLTKEYVQKIKTQEKHEGVKKQTGQYIGRVSGVFKRISKHLILLEDARKIISKFPAIDAEQFTVAIAGFPNVGKSTLLKKLTRAKPEIDNYAFTTKGLNTGSFEYKFSPIQLVDTPGTLARTKENDIERLATITRQYAARLVVYVFDYTEPFPLKDQKKLYEQIREEGHDMILYLSKTDVLQKEVIADAQKDFPEIYTSPADIKKAIKKAFDAYQ